MPFYSLSSTSVVEAASASAFPATGAANTIYVARDTNFLYRWNSTAYVVVASAKDEVIEGATLSAFPATGEAGNIYIALDTGKAYRWTTGGYVEVSAAPVTSVGGRTGAISLTSSDVGLGNVNNTSDASKPVSTAQAAADSAVATTAANDATTKADAAKAYAIQRANHTGTQAISTVSGLQTALDSKQDGGSYATLDGGGKVPATLLPSYVDDVIEAASLSYLNASVTGETGKIYVTLDNNKTFRWSGSTFVEISASPGSTDAVTEGSVNLYFTNSRASAAAPVQQVAGKTGNVSITKSDVGLGNVDNTSDAAKPVSTATQTALDGKAATSHTHGNLTNSGAIGTTSGQIVVTTTGGALTTAATIELSQVVNSDYGYDFTGSTINNFFEQLANNGLNDAIDAVGGVSASNVHLEQYSDSYSYTLDTANIRDFLAYLALNTTASFVSIRSMLGVAASSHTHHSSQIYNFASAAVAAVTWSTITGKPTFATVATSGSADDLTGTLSASRLPTSGATAGTYSSVTVDSYGRVTAGTNPTIAGESFHPFLLAGM
jgi:hypothetical protein